MANQRHDAFCMDTLRQHHESGYRRDDTPRRAADSGNPSAEGFVKREDQRQHRRRSKAGYGAVDQIDSVHFAPSFCA
ncbi:hypothetical protein D3C81_1647860 [compost metagenome]